MSPPTTAQALWEGWREAKTQGRPMSAKAHADTLLDTMKYLDKRHEPLWTPAQKRRFLNWCEENGLLKKS